MPPLRPTPRLYLVTPPVADAAAFARVLETALPAGDIAAVLLRLADADERTLINRAKALAETVQRRDVALILDGRPGIVARAGADGAHLTGTEAFAAALALLKPDRIAGAGGLSSRHDAMLAAETGADYVMFGDPPPREGGLTFEDILERLFWWAELFEVACVGYAASLDQVGPIAKTGADFVALGEWIWTEPQNTAATIAAAAQQLASAPAQAGGGGPRVAWWRGPLTHRMFVVAREIVAARAPPTALRAVPPPRYRGAGCITLALVTIALTHPASAQTKPQPKLNAAPPVQYAPQTVLPPPPNAPPPDLAFGAFQRGYFFTAFRYATDGAQDGNAPSMTLLGELYANGLGVPQDDAKAADWYKLAAARGDRNAMFALAMFALQGRAGPRDRAQSAKWLAAAAKLGHPEAAYDLALLYIEGQLFPQDFKRAAELLRVAADAGSPQAQYALGTFYKDGRGVSADMHEAVKLWAAAALADDTDAQVEYAIALYNGDGVARDEDEAAAIFRKAAEHGSAIAQDRYARILASGLGAPRDPVKAVKWHLVSRAGGETDITLDDFMAKLDAATVAEGTKLAQPWLDALKKAQAARAALAQAPQQPPQTLGAPAARP